MGEDRSCRNIAIVMPLAEVRGGAEVALVHLMQAGQGKGVNWTILFLEDGPMVADCERLGATCHVISAGRLRQVGKFIKTVRRIAQELRDAKADLVCGWMTKAHLYGGLAAKLAGVPSTWFQMGLPSGRFDLDFIATKIPAKGIFVCSKFVGDAQRRLNPSRPIHVSYLAAELGRFDPALLPSPAVCRERLGLPLNSPLIGLCGRLQSWKGVHVLIDAVAELKSRFPDLHCVIVGGKHDLEADYPEQLRRQIARLSLEDCVRMVGLQRNVPEWIQAMDVPIHASDSEPFGIVVIENMAMAKPIVAGATGGPAEVITPGVNGLLSPYGDAKALATAIARYLDDPAFAEKVGQAARNRAMEFSTERFADSFIAGAREFAASKA